MGGAVGKPGRVVGEGLGFDWICGYPWVGEFDVLNVAVTLRFTFIVTYAIEPLLESTPLHPVSW
jgi:hypothetical protein